MFTELVYRQRRFITRHHLHCCTNISFVLIVTLKANGKQQESVLCFGNSAHVELVTALETDIHHYKTGPNMESIGQKEGKNNSWGYDLTADIGSGAQK